MSPVPKFAHLCLAMAVLCASHCSAQAFYRIVTDPITVTFEPQFGNTVDLLSSLNLGASHWTLKTGVFDLNWQYVLAPVQLYGVRKRPDFRELIEQNLSFGVDYATGPANSTSVTFPQAFDLGRMQQCVTVYVRFQANGRAIREALQR